jgi:hypothetical protein
MSSRGENRFLRLCQSLRCQSIMRELVAWERSRSKVESRSDLGTFAHPTRSDSSPSGARYWC